MVDENKKIGINGLTRILAIRDCLNMWNWLSKHPTKKDTVGRTIFTQKSDWPGWEKYYRNISHTECLCCTWSSKVAQATRSSLFDSECDFCPLVWPGGYCMERYDRNNEEVSGLYSEWCFSSSWQKRSAIAKKIANLPVRPIRRIRKSAKS